MGALERVRTYLSRASQVVEVACCLCAALYMASGCPGRFASSRYTPKFRIGSASLRQAADQALTLL